MSVTSQDLDRRHTFSKHLRRARNGVIGRVIQLYPILSNPLLNRKTGTHSPDTNLRQPFVTHESLQPPEIPRARAKRSPHSHGPLKRNRFDGVPLDKLNRKFFSSESPAMKTAIMQKAFGTTKHEPVY
ncbi:hypothetical protein Trydic_g7939 [Trypoxylus dichotomus]